MKIKESIERARASKDNFAGNTDRYLSPTGQLYALFSFTSAVIPSVWLVFPKTIRVYRSPQSPRTYGNIAREGK